MIKVTKNLKEANCITHAGVFHSDEVFATVILEDLLDTDIVIARVFKIPEDTDAIVYDIGHGELDHHQRGGNGARDNNVPYASCGLVWKKYASIKYNQNMIDYIDNILIQMIDANDNGVIPKFDYCVNIMNLCNVISLFNTTWDDNNIDNDNQFIEACNTARVIYKLIIKKAESTFKAVDLVNAAIDNDIDDIIVLDTFMPWQSTLFAHDKNDKFNFIIFPSNRGGYSCQCIPSTPGGFDQRIPLPENWRGLSGDELEKECGVEGAIFCHNAGFLCSNRTLKGAIEMAKLAKNNK